MTAIRSEVKKLLESLKELGIWQDVQKEILDSTASELNNVQTPEDAFRVAMAYQTAQSAFARIEQKL